MLNRRWFSRLAPVLAAVAALMACGGPPQPPQTPAGPVVEPARSPATGLAVPRSWAPLARDGLHDPESPAMGILQEPAAALGPLPPDYVGNQVRWVHALRDGHITPRTNIFPDTEIQILDKDIFMTETAGMPIVRFPHRPHTEWLDCANCHDHMFKRQAGATPVNMFAILQGEYCGRCHGAVAFPLTECSRCHSVPRNLIK